jgi:protein-tyrosine phosphatase
LRTSASNPIQVAWILEGPKGRLGVTFAPGKRAPSAYGEAWARDLEADLDRLVRDLGTEVLVPLLEEEELSHLGITDLVARAKAKGLLVERLEIRDGDVPERSGAERLVSGILAHLEAGRTIVVHCRGGLGRAGTIAACVLVALGAEARAAMERVRAARPGAIENRMQERFVESFVLRRAS